MEGRLARSRRKIKLKMLIRRLFFFCLVISPLPTFFSCSSKESFEFAEWREKINENEKRRKIVRCFDVNDLNDYDWPEDSLLKRECSGIETARRRARQLVEIKWTPCKSVPSCYGFYPKDQEQTSIPYSFAYMTNTHIGTQVSLHTFMTALQNPYSVIYSENLGKAPYYGSSDSAPYYGSTCSNSLMYVLGIDPPYYSRMVERIPGMERAIEQTPGSIELCDVLWRQGHLMMVYDIQRNENGEIIKVVIFETTRNNQIDTWFNEMTFDDFVIYWRKAGIIRYQYSKLNENTDYSLSVFVPLDDEPSYPYNYNYDICPTLGDRCSYLEGCPVDLAILSDYYSRVLLYRNGEYYDTVDVKIPITTFYNLPYGEYRACLVRDGIRSGFTCFEVIDVDIEARVDSVFHILFSSKNGSAIYVSLCNSKGNTHFFYSLDDENRRCGEITMKKFDSSLSTHCRVYLRGKYGVVSTAAIPF